MRKLLISSLVLSVLVLSSSTVISLITAEDRDDSSQSADNIRNPIISDPCETDNKLAELCEIFNKEKVNKLYIVDSTNNEAGNYDTKGSQKEDERNNYPIALDEVQNVNELDNTLQDIHYDINRPSGPNNAGPIIITDLDDLREVSMRKPFNTYNSRQSVKNDLMDEKPHLANENELNRAINVLKIKARKGYFTQFPYYNENLRKFLQENNLKTVTKKRYVSLWSQLQAVSPSPGRGREPHRRHLHLFYHHLPEEIDGRPILDDPRELFKRPPGSPLRWG